jgi:ABC-2 type transport system ATP-binding protein
LHYCADVSLIFTVVPRQFKQWIGLVKSTQELVAFSIASKSTCLTFSSPIFLVSRTLRPIPDFSNSSLHLSALPQVFLHESDLYLLDEPTANLDPAVSKEIRDIILKLSKDKMILYSSHNLYEATDIGTYLILIKNGSVTLFDKISNIKPKQYRVGIKTSSDISKIIDAQREGDYFVLNVSSPEEAGLTLKKLVESGVLVTEMRQLDNPLQELFESPNGKMEETQKESLRVAK